SGAGASPSGSLGGAVGPGATPAARQGTSIRTSSALSRHRGAAGGCFAGSRRGGLLRAREAAILAARHRRAGAPRGPRVAAAGDRRHTAGESPRGVVRGTDLPPDDSLPF